MTCSEGIKILLSKGKGYGIKRQHWAKDAYWKLDRGYVRFVKGCKECAAPSSVANYVTNDWKIIKITEDS